MGWTDGLRGMIVFLLLGFAAIPVGPVSPLDWMWPN